MIALFVNTSGAIHFLLIVEREKQQFVKNANNGKE
jgi:hypothetical protein